MCGINGFNFKDDEALAGMNEAIKHRGPNDNGTYTDELVSLGQVRLSILDLSPLGKQPMLYEHKNKKVEIVFNGEVYNYKEIRDELEKLGYKFKSGSDTEVIEAAYLEYGPACTKKFNGMWAFAIYDFHKKTLFLSRDRLGVKPLYYYYDKGVFIFSSELKGILAHKRFNINNISNVDKTAVDFYFSLGFVPSPISIYKNVYKLEASQNLIFDLTRKKIVKKYKYYDVPDYKPNYNEDELIAEGKKLLNDSVMLRMRSDVPVGAFLSGGLDSSTVVGVMKEFTELEKLNTFSIGFEGAYDETKYINIVKDAFKTKHHHYYFKESDFKDTLDKYAFYYDEPFGDYSGFPSYKVSELAKKYATVVLSGDGGDEVFGGYDHYKTGALIEILRHVPKGLRTIFANINKKKNKNSRDLVYSLKRAFELSLIDPAQFYVNKLKGLNSKAFKDWTVKNLKLCLKKSNGVMAEALRLYDILFNNLADNFLTKVDRASMAHAIEVRSPFLDYRFIDYSQKIPSKYKVSLNLSKILMRKIIKGIIPEEIIKRKKKQGFTPPLKDWFMTKKYDEMTERFLAPLKSLNDSWYKFYTKQVFNPKSELPMDYKVEYKIRLLLFGCWFNKWIKGQD